METGTGVEPSSKADKWVLPSSCMENQSRESGNWGGWPVRERGCCQSCRVGLLPLPEEGPGGGQGHGAGHAVLPVKLGSLTVEVKTWSHEGSG